MSIPRNPLDKYRSVTMHHILMVSSTTDELRDFTRSDPAADMVALSAIQATPVGQKIQVTNQKDDSQSGVYLILDSRRTSEFQLQEIMFQTSFGSGTPGQTHIITSPVEMTLVDTSGIVFINWLKYIFETKLKTDFHGTYFLLKTIFVGHTYEGNVETVSTSTLVMQILNMSFTVGYKEGIYKLSGVASLQASGNFNKFCKIKDTKTFVSNNGTFGGMLDNVEQEVNSAYKKWFNNLKVENKSANDDQASLVQVPGRLTQIMITYPDSWKNFKVDTVKSKQAEKNHKTQNNTAEIKNTPQQLSVQKDSTVYDIVEQVCRHTPEVAALANDKALKDNKKIKLYKTITSTTSNEQTTVIHFDIVEYELFEVKPNDNTPTANDKNFYTNEQGQRVPLNSIMFDYIFTGKNSDIISLDLSVEYANLLLVKNDKSGVNAGKEVNSQKIPQNETNTENKQQVSYVLSKGPVLFPSERKDQVSGGYNQERLNSEAANIAANDRSEWIRNVQMAHGRSSLGLVMTIRGNPELLPKYLIDLIPEHVITESVDLTKIDSTTNNLTITWDSQKRKYRQELEQFLSESSDASGAAAFKGPHALTSPLFVKVNILSPNTMRVGSETFSLDINSNGMFTKFWYDGWYMIQNITTKISGGEFVQEFTLTAYEIFGPDTIAKEQKE